MGAQILMLNGAAVLVFLCVLLRWGGIHLPARVLQTVRRRAASAWRSCCCCCARCCPLKHRETECSSNAGAGLNRGPLHPIVSRTQGVQLQQQPRDNKQQQQVPPKPHPPSPRAVPHPVLLAARADAARDALELQTWGPGAGPNSEDFGLDAAGAPVAARARAGGQQPAQEPMPLELAASWRNHE